MSFKAACIQTNSGNDSAANIALASELIREAADQGAQFITLPENVAMMSANTEELFANATLPEDHPALQAFSALAGERGIWLLIGSLTPKIPGEEKLANRSYLIDDKGHVAETYDKIHLYDVKLANGDSYQESNRFTSGTKAVTTDLPWCRLGMTICYDVRFPQLYRKLAQAGAEIIAVPSAFTAYTGAAHWHTLLRARAIENGCYIIAPAMTGTHPSGRETYGHSLIIDPWGEILADAGAEEGIILADIDPAKVQETRTSLPSLKHDREWK